MHEVMSALEWLDNLLRSDATLTTLAPGGIWQAIAPSGVETPYIIIAHQSGSDATTHNGVRLMSKSLFQIKAVGPVKKSVQAVANAATRLDELLEPLGRPEETGTSIIYSSCREAPLLYYELDPAGEKWVNAGGLYKVQNR